MLNNQEHITTQLEKVLYEILPITSKRLKNLNNKNFKHIKEGVSELNEFFTAYNYEVILLGDRGFKSIDLFRFINELGWKYCIRCTNDMLVKIEGKEKYIAYLLLV